jgi:hypothetical protein
MKTTELTVASALPTLPARMHSVLGSGIVEEDLILHQGYSSAADAMQDWLNRNQPERANHSACFWLRPVRGDNTHAVVLFIPQFEKCQHWVIGKTLNDPVAARILIGNSRAGQWLPGIRWELYGDPHREELLDIGSFHQWGLLSDVSSNKLEDLKEQGVVPQGDWDFQQLLFERTCNACGRKIAINAHLFNIDSAVCSNCGNRPFLARSLHAWSEELGNLGLHSESEMSHFSRHTIQWMAGVQAQFKQIRRDANDKDGSALATNVWKHSLVAQAANPETENQVRGLIERHGVNFEMYQAGCRVLQDALMGKVPFAQEHEITMRFVIESTELIQVRRIDATSKSN